MNLLQNVSLAPFSTMGLGGNARYVCEVQTRQEAIEAIRWAADNQLPILMVGGGSNIVWRDEGFSGLVIVNRITGFELSGEDDMGAYLQIGAGENWEKIVGRAVTAGYSGIEALSLIPGTAGATPIQNVGAYGQEIADTLVTVEAYDTQAKTTVMIPASDCGFGYRTSRFKTTDRGRFFILAITLHLFKTAPLPPFYPAVQSYFETHDITNYTTQAVRDAVIAIRSVKLPDPAVVKNNGSFFANPIVNQTALTDLLDLYPDMPHWNTDDGNVKLSAAWLLEQAGFKDFHDPETGMATWPTQPLVFYNENAKSTANLLTFKQKLVDAVANKFGVTLIQEPELLPFDITAK